MPLIRFTENIQRHVACPPRTLPGGTVREALEAYFSQTPAARSYVLDEQGALRRHMVIFIGGQPIADRRRLADAVTEETTIDVMQALSGG